MATLEQLITDRSALRPGSFPDTGAFAPINHAEDLHGKTWSIQYRFVPGRSRNLKSKGRLQKHYKCLMQFGNVHYQDNKDAKHPLKIEVFPGRWKFMTIPSSTRDWVKVSCSCPDYYWTWWYYNKTKALAYAGDDPTLPQGRRADGSSYGTIPGSRNDAQTPGLCKHLYVMSEDLKKKGKLT